MKPRVSDLYEALDQGQGGARLDLVELDQYSKPSCVEHGAMNAVSSRDKGGLWRCLAGQCRAGCKTKG